MNSARFSVKFFLFTKWSFELFDFYNCSHFDQDGIISKQQAANTRQHFKFSCSFVLRLVSFCLGPRQRVVNGIMGRVRAHKSMALHPRNSVRLIPHYVEVHPRVLRDSWAHAPRVDCSSKRTTHGHWRLSADAG